VGGPRASLGCFGGRSLMPLLGIEPQFLGHPTHSLITILTGLTSYLPYSKFHCCRYVIEGIQNGLEQCERT
jgi:hypothetical protein